VSKWEAELGLEKVCSQTGMEFVIIRPPLVYGPGVKANFQKLMGLVAKGLPLPLGAVHNLRSMLALDNLVSFIAEVMKNPLAANQRFLLSESQSLLLEDSWQVVQNFHKAFLSNLSSSR
jgi:nucleoside-diphosphate-sugar epimerase